MALGGSHVRGQTATDPKLKKIEDFNAGKTDEKPLDLLKRALIAIGCSADDFDAAKAKLSEKFKDDEKEITAEFCAEFGFGLHKPDRDDSKPATGGPAPVWWSAHSSSLRRTSRLNVVLCQLRPGKAPLILFAATNRARASDGRRHLLLAESDPEVLVDAVVRIGREAVGGLHGDARFGERGAELGSR